MADATWPGTLPIDHFLRLRDKMQSNRVRTAMDGGPAKQRRRFTSNVRFVQEAITLTNTQRVTFDTFYGTTLGDGVDEFNWIDPQGTGSVEFRFTADPQFTSVGLRSDGPVWRTTLPLEILP
jgi:hypothetical protein